MRGPMSDRYTIVTMAFVAGLMLGRNHGAAQRPNKPAPRNLGLQYNHAMRCDGAVKGVRVN